ncbi:hypothetical protein ACFE04_029314 [Oxalis oulophora]
MTKDISFLLILMVITPLLITQSRALPCTEIMTGLTPCITYIINGGIVPIKCCINAKKVLLAPNTKATRQQTCICLQSIVSSSRGMTIANVAQIPPKCGFKAPFKISMHIDCKKVE